MKAKGKNKAAWLLFLAAAVLASCGGEGKGDGGASSDTDKGSDNNEASLAAAVERLPDVDYGGYTMNFLVQNNQGAAAQHIDIFAEEDSGEPIVAAVWRRNSLIAEHLNVNIKETLSKTDEPPATMARDSVLAGEQVYDVIVDALAYTFLLVPEGIFLDWNEVPGVDMDAEWWDQDLRHDLSVGGKVYVMNGDISIRDNWGTQCFLFNRELASEFDFDPYALVREGKWTYEAVHEMAKKVTEDTTGDGSVDLADRWGFLSDYATNYALWIGSGEDVITKDADDLPVWNPLTTRGSSVMDAVLELQKDKSATYIVQTNEEYETTEDVFRRGDALFMSTQLVTLTSLRDSASTIGLLPCPKYNEEQSEYINTFSIFWVTGFSIPSNAANAERTGVVLEAMSELSMYTLTPAYFDVTLEGKAIKDEDSVEMLGMLLSNRKYDIASVFNWGAVTTHLTFISDDNRNLATILESDKRATERAIKIFIDQLDNLE